MASVHIYRRLCCFCAHLCLDGLLIASDGYPQTGCLGSVS